MRRLILMAMVLAPMADGMLAPMEAWPSQPDYCGAADLRCPSNTPCCCTKEYDLPGERARVKIGSCFSKPLGQCCSNAPGGTVDILGDFKKNVLVETSPPGMGVEEETSDISIALAKTTGNDGKGNTCTEVAPCWSADSVQSHLSSAAPARSHVVAKTGGARDDSENTANDGYVLKIPIMEISIDMPSKQLVVDHAKTMSNTMEIISGPVDATLNDQAMFSECMLTFYDSIFDTNPIPWSTAKTWKFDGDARIKDNAVKYVVKMSQVISKYNTKIASKRSSYKKFELTSVEPAGYNTYFFVRPSIGKSNSQLNFGYKISSFGKGSLAEDWAPSIARDSYIRLTRVDPAINIDPDSRITAWMKTYPASLAHLVDNDLAVGLFVFLRLHWWMNAYTGKLPGYHGAEVGMRGLKYVGTQENFISESHRGFDWKNDWCMMPKFTEMNIYDQLDDTAKGKVDKWWDDLGNNNARADSVCTDDTYKAFDDLPASPKDDTTGKFYYGETLTFRHGGQIKIDSAIQTLAACKEGVKAQELSTDTEARASLIRLLDYAVAPRPLNLIKIGSDIAGVFESRVSGQVTRDGWVVEGKDAKDAVFSDQGRLKFKVNDYEDATNKVRTMNGLDAEATLAEVHRNSQHALDAFHKDSRFHEKAPLLLANKQRHPMKHMLRSHM